jgi:WD40 repeat protein
MIARLNAAAQRLLAEREGAIISSLRADSELGINAHVASVTALTFHPEGHTLDSGGADGVLKLWNLPLIRKELAKLWLDW